MAAIGSIPKEAIVAFPKETAIFPTLLKGPQRREAIPFAIVDNDVVRRTNDDARETKGNGGDTIDIKLRLSRAILWLPSYDLP